MSDEENFSNRITKRRVLVPVKKEKTDESKLTTSRPKMILKPLKEEQQINDNKLISTEKTKENKVNNMDKNKFIDEYEKLMQSLDSSNNDNGYVKVNTPTPTNNNEKATVKQATNQDSSKPITTNNTRFFKFPSERMPQGGSSRMVHWQSPGQYSILDVNGAEAQFVGYANWHLNGAKLWMGTSASKADQKTGNNPATGVCGLIANSIKELVELTKGAISCSGSKLDHEGRPLQFGIIAVLGGQDHKSILRETRLFENNKLFSEAFRAAGAPNASLRAALYNEMGELFAFEVNLGNPETFGKGKHLLFIHPANDIGGGKSDESLMDGRLSFQAASLGRQFQWWKTALEYGDGRIGSLETTLGGTARLGRYALLAARIPRTLFSADATEIINVDKADFVKENLQSQAQEYRASYATTLLRTVWGTVGKRFRNIPITIVDRYDNTIRNVHRQRSTIAVLRHLFLGSPKLDLLRGDISDERIATTREEAITNNDYLTIHDTDNSDKNGPWQQHRRVRMSTSHYIPTGKLLQMSRAENPQAVIDDTEAIIANIRGLATSDEQALRSGGFVILDALVPEKLTISGSGMTKDTISRALELIAKGLEKNGAEKVLINMYNIPTEISRDNSAVVIQITEDQPGTNVLMVSTEEIDTHSKRVILQNPVLSSISDNTVSSVYAFGRLLGRMVTAHLESGYHNCIEDGLLIRAFHRHYFGGSFGHRPNILPGGTNRMRNKVNK